MHGRNFNSRPREGANGSVREVIIVFQISIPAPARGRTGPGCLLHCVVNFNSRPREGANRCFTCQLSQFQQFQFPPPRGGEHRPGQRPTVQRLDFNSRPREGANPFRGLVLHAGINFNSRPREGANVWPALPEPGPAYFNSRPREGANTGTGGR